MQSRCRAMPHFIQTGREPTKWSNKSGRWEPRGGRAPADDSRSGHPICAGLYPWLGSLETPETPETPETRPDQTIRSHEEGFSRARRLRWSFCPLDVEGIRTVIPMLEAGLRRSCHVRPRRDPPPGFHATKGCEIAQPSHNQKIQIRTSL